MEVKEAIVLFDGYCNLCNGSVDFIIKNEKHNQLKFASLQSEIAQSVLKEWKTDLTGDSVLVLAEGKLLTFSDAAIFISKHLRFPFSMIQYGRFIPRFIRDAIYKWIAKNRYRWFGKKDTCRLPTEAEKSKFLG